MSNEAVGPELGQALFGQPSQAHGPNRETTAALDACDSLWDMLRYAAQSPFINAGQRYNGKLFTIHAYSWDDDEDQQFNFAWRDFRASWYKYNGRGVSVNRQLAKAEAREMLREYVKELANE